MKVTEEQLRTRMRAASLAQLRAILAASAGEYTQDALEAARSELAARPQENPLRRQGVVNTLVSQKSISQRYRILAAITWTPIALSFLSIPVCLMTGFLCKVMVGGPAVSAVVGFLSLFFLPRPGERGHLFVVAPFFISFIYAGLLLLLLLSLRIS